MNIGEVVCPHCTKVAAVRRYKTGSGKLYYSCGTCGIIRPATQAGQDWILEHAKLYGPEGAPAPAAVIEPEREPVEVLDLTTKPAANDPAPAKRSGWTFL